MTDASSVIARLRELNAARTHGALEIDRSAYVASSKICDIVQGERTVAEFVHEIDAAAIVAALNAQEALLSCAEALAEFSAHYPYGINPYLDEAASNARAALAALAKVGGA